MRDSFQAISFFMKERRCEMKDKLYFDYYYGKESEQFTFFRVPKLLFTDERFKSLSSDAKILYGILLDRMSLSKMNEWLDEENRVYIIFPIEDIAEIMKCGTQKATKLLKELDGKNGIGLVEKRRIGLGKPNILYVKNFVTSGKIITKQESLKSQSLNCENHHSEIVKINNLELLKSQCNNTNINNTKVSNTNFNNTSSTKREKTKEKHRLVEEIKKNINYEKLIKNYSKDMPKIDLLLEIIIESLNSKDASRINGREVDAKEIKTRFKELNNNHIEYVLKYLKDNAPRKINNLRAYLLTLLYNSFINIDQDKIINQSNNVKMINYDKDQEIWEKFLNES